MNRQMPLRILDVPDPDGAPPLDQWAILSQHQPLVLAHDNAAVLNPWSSCRSHALLMPWLMALRCAQRLVSGGDAVVLVRGNTESWKWLMLVTEWPRDAQCELTDNSHSNS
jgi:hypothetical protein